MSNGRAARSTPAAGPPGGVGVPGVRVAAAPPWRRRGVKGHRPTECPSGSSRRADSGGDASHTTRVPPPCIDSSDRRGTKLNAERDFDVNMSAIPYGTRAAVPAARGPSGAILLRLVHRNRDGPSVKAIGALVVASYRLGRKAKVRRLASCPHDADVRPAAARTTGGDRLRVRHPLSPVGPPSRRPLGRPTYHQTGQSKCARPPEKEPAAGIGSRVTGFLYDTPCPMSARQIPMDTARLADKWTGKV
jgi:hypothetical protein